MERYFDDIYSSCVARYLKREFKFWEKVRRGLLEYYRDKGDHLSKLEHELEISDGEGMDCVTKLFGYKVIADTAKTRRKCRTGKYKICVDSVKERGIFLKIEEMTAEDPAQA